MRGEEDTGARRGDERGGSSGVEMSEMGWMGLGCVPFYLSWLSW